MKPRKPSGAFLHRHQLRVRDDDQRVFELRASSRWFEPLTVASPAIAADDAGVEPLDAGQHERESELKLDW